MEDIVRGEKEKGRDKSERQQKNREKEGWREKRSKEREVQDKVGYVDKANRERLRSEGEKARGRGRGGR